MSLSSCALSPSSRALLHRAGFHTRASVISTSLGQLAAELGVDHAMALNIVKSVKINAGEAGNEENDEKNAANTNNNSSNIIIGSSNKQVGESALLLSRRALVCISLLCPRLDAVLGGGVTLRQITELCGVPGVGKTQFCVQLCCNVQIPSHLGGLNGKAIYIDTEGSFMCERAYGIASGIATYVQHESERTLQNRIKANRGVAINDDKITPESLLSNIFVYRIFDHLEQLACVRALPAFLRENKDVRLIVLDSVAFHFRRGFNDMALRSRMLTGLAQELLHIAQQYNLAVVVTNQVTTKLGGDTNLPSAASSMGSSSLSTASSPSSVLQGLTPALGESWAHSCTNRMMLEWSGNERLMRLLKSSHMRMQEEKYTITEEGIKDVDAGNITTPAVGSKRKEM